MSNVIEIDDNAINQIQSLIGIKISAALIVDEALTILHWALQQRSEGRCVASCLNDGSNFVVISSPFLRAASNK